LDRLGEDRVLLMDGALGTELVRRGFPLSSGLWSAAALLDDPNLVQNIHRDYVLAGAELLTANTFRTHRRNLEAKGLGECARDLTKKAVELARHEAMRSSHPVWVAGSQAPLGDCYSPEQVPDDETLLREHAETARNLAAAGVDVILVETQNTIREASVAASVAASTGLPVLVSFVCGQDSRLLSGESLTDAVNAIRPFHPAAVLVNCLPAFAVPKALSELMLQAPDVPVGVYANTGCYDARQDWQATPMERPDIYAQEALRWRDLGAKLIGGCCGTTPAHIRQTRLALFPAL
jgi:S-methylmethionine-dependent homocysteine/selenocysteine methylase